MANKFVDYEFEIIIKNVINEEFSQLSQKDKNLIEYYLNPLIEFLSVYLVDSSLLELFKQDLLNNDKENIRWLLNYLLPNIKEGKKKEIKNLNDIYVKKEKEVDLKKKEVKYYFSNIQYNLINRKNFKEKEFNKKMMDDNYNLLIYSIIKSRLKLYPNYIDILPSSYVAEIDQCAYTLSLFKDESKDIIEENIIELTNPEKFKSFDFSEKLAESRYVGPELLYNTLCNFLVLSIFKTKWLIYEIPLGYGNLMGKNKIDSDVVITSIPNIYFIFNYFELKNYNFNLKWNELTDNERKIFEKKLNNMKKILIENNDIVLEDSTLENDINIDNENFILIIKNILVGFEMHAINKGSSYKSLNIGTIRSGDLDNVNLSKISKKKLEESFESLESESIYNFLINEINDFKNTYYAKLIFDEKLENLNNISDLYLLTNDVMSVEIKGVEIYVNLNVKLLYNFSKCLIFDIENEDGEDIFILKNRNWESLNNNEKNKFLEKINNKDEKSWFNISKLIYNTSGILVIPESEIRKKALKDIRNKYYEYFMKSDFNIIYYIFDCLLKNGCLTYYKPCPKFTDRSLVKNRKDINKKIIEKMNENELGYSFLNNSNNKYNNDYINFIKENGWNSRVSLHYLSQIGLCSRYLNQRVNFITGGTGIGKSTIIPFLYLYYSKSLDYNLTGSVVCTQPRIGPTKSNSETISNQLGFPIRDKENQKLNNYFIQYKYQGDNHVKDGSFPKLKFTTDGSLVNELRNPLLLKKIGNKYINKNLYDILIIDESHEHNKNMDLILTILRNISHYNNKLKIVIMSATIEDDEMIYRRFYRNINDNRKYPLDRYIEENKIDRINFDRRIHIPAPARYKIREKYVENMDCDDVVIEILNKSDKGDILLFRTGKDEIIKSLENINKKTKNNIIAIPFLRELPEDYKNIFIDKFEENSKSIKLQKNYTLDDISNGNWKIGDQLNYKRFVIISTNIAEASITINSLDYVVDNGKEKISEYNYKNKTTDLKIVDITESSRIQRRGRVGRIRDGTAYFTYKKDDKINNKIKYKFCLEDITYDIYNLIKDKEEEKIFLKYDLNKPKINFNLNEIFKKELNDIENLIIDSKEKNKEKEKINSLYEIVKDFYFINDNYYEYYGIDNCYDYENYENCYIYSETGYNPSYIYDNSCKFYIIHPDELKISRNIIGEVINVSNDSVSLKNKKIKSEKINIFFDNLIKYFLISLTKTGINKTEIGILLRKLENEFSEKIKNYRDISDILYLIYSIVFDCDDEIIKYLSMIYSLNFNLSRFFIQNKKKYEIDNNSDVISLIRIGEVIEKNLEKNKLDIDIIKIFEKENKNKILVKDNVNQKLLSILNKLENKIDTLLNKNKDILFKSIVKEYVINLNRIKIILYLNKLDEDNKIDFNFFKQKYRSLKSIVSNKIYDKITAILMISKPNNICKYMFDNYYLPINNSTINGIVKLNMDYFSNNIFSYVTNNNLKGYIYYDNYNSLNNQINIYHNITKNDLKLISHLYTIRGLELKYNKRESIDVETIGYQVKKLYTKKFNELINDLKSIRSLAFLGKLSEIEINLQYLYKIFDEEKIE